jgi:hypothetical protein
MEKKQKTRAAAIKQKINREESKWMWYLIKQIAWDPQSPSILNVQRVINREVQEYKTQEDIENAIQRECEVHSFLHTLLPSFPHSCANNYITYLAKH